MLFPCYSFKLYVCHWV